MKMTTRWTSKPSASDWRQHCTLAFKDSNGVAYWRYQDEMLIPMPRMNEIQTGIREVLNKVNDTDLTAFLNNQSKIIFGTEAAEKKLELLAKHQAIMKERVEFTVAAPDLLMGLVAALYIRDDEDPTVISEEIKRAKIEQFTKDSRGVLADFFYKAGLSAYLPSESGLVTGTEQLLRLSAEMTIKARRFEKDIAEATS